MRRVIGISVVLFVLLVLAAAMLLFRKGPPQQQVALADGRTIHIEAVTYGTNHQVGVRSVILDRFGPWLPQMIRPIFEPKFPQSQITRTHPALVIWVNATDAAGKPVDSQAVRVELLDEHGEPFGEEDRHWFGFGKFSRVGHIFDAYPRHLKELKVQLTPWRTNQTSIATIVNPRVQIAALWQGDSLPARQRVGQTEVVLQRLTEQAHGSKHWETRTRYWEPVWELWQNGRLATGWEAPHWVAEDPTGNRGKYLGIQPVLRYSATFYPSATNEDVARLIGRLPRIAVENLQSNLLWNTNLNVESARIFVLGVLPPGVNTFTGGAYDPKPAVTMSAVSGGAPSGWTSSSRRVTPARQQHWHGHYTPVPALYIKALGLKSDIRIGVRLRDDAGHYWLAKPEPQGITSDGIHAFLLELPPEIKAVKPEVVILQPVQATFQVRTPAP